MIARGASGVTPRGHGAAVRAGCAALALALLPPGPARAAVANEAEEIMRAAIRQSSAVDEVVQIELRLISQNGEERRRTATLYTKKKSGEDDMRLIRFLSPPDLADSGVLSLERSDGDDDQWLYMPAYHASRKIATVNRGGTWMGTDFAYEDIVDPKPSEYRYTITGQETIDQTACTIIEAIPQAPRLVKQSAYSKMVYWVDRARSVFLKVDYYDRRGRLSKKLTNSSLTTVGRYLRWGKSEMEYLERRHRTILEFSGWKVDEGLSDKYFTVRYLERGM